MSFVVGVSAALGATTVPAARCAAAGEGSQKRSYSLFDPTPRALMREFSTDRPDVTESPRTVDAGHFQVEMSLVEYARDEDGGSTLDEFVVAPFNLKVGLLNNLDLQLVVEPYVHQRIEAGGDDVTHRGFGNTQVRAKLNLWGNDGGNTALALMPFVQFPTADDDLGGPDDVEGGLIVPLGVALPNEWNLGLMAEVDFVRNADDHGYGVAFVHTATLGHAIAGDLSGYVEYVGIASHDLGEGYLALVGAGLTYGLTPDVQLDTGAYFGLSDAADDFLTFVGISFRL